MSDITRRGFLQAAAGVLLLRCVLRVSADEGPPGRLSVPQPQYAHPLGDGSYLVSSITPTGLSRLSVVSPSGTRHWATTGAGTGALLHPQGVSIDENGVAYVCDSRNGRVAVFEPDGTPGEPIGRMGFLPGQFHLPQGCDVRGTTLAVADTQNHRVQLIDTLTREVQCVIGRLGDGEDGFRRPSDVAFVDDDTLWILDAGHGRAVRHDMEGKRVGELPVPHGAQGVSVVRVPAGSPRGRRLVTGTKEHGDHFDLVVVADTKGNRVQLLGSNGGLHGRIAGLVSPRGIRADGEGRIVICESGADRLSVFELPRLD